MTADTLSMFAGAILSLVFSYVPGLKDRFDGLYAEYKRLAMLLLVIAFAAAAYGLACSGLASDFGLSVTCDRPGLVSLARAVILAAVANQGTYSLTKRE